MEEIWNLRNVRLFNGLDALEMDEVLKTMPVSSYRKNEFVFMAGDIADCVYIVQVGTVKVSYVDLNGEEKILNIFQSGDMFGNLFLGKYRQRIGNAEALADVIVCRLTEADFVTLVQQFPMIALNFIRHQADEHRETVARMHSLMSMDAKHRLLGTLLSLARRYCCDQSEWFALPESLTQEDIANMTGLNRSTVSLIINELRREQILGGRGRSLTVNRQAVEQILEDSGSEILE
ncbi:MAG: Crp/Fnr family transcriptional regulator [Anaerolineae bacterium]